jgi:uncharacterized integral membrane protein
MQYKAYLGLALFLLVVIFIVQNAEVVDIRFLAWKLSMSRALIVFFVLAIGIVIGWITAGHFSRRRGQA